MMNENLAIKILTLLVFNLTVVALLTLVFFVSKTLVRLYLEKRHRVPGYKFKTRIVTIFVTLTLIPSILLFVIASGLISAYVDRWLNPQIRVPLESSLSIASLFYDRAKEEVLAEARKVLSGQDPADGFSAERLYTMPENPTETIKRAFEGEEGTEVISAPYGDIIRAVVPLGSGGEARGVLVVEKVLSPRFVSQAEKVRSAYEDYIALERWRTPIKANYMLAFGFFTVLIVFMTMWVSLRISRGITEPIQRLAQATEDIARGDLDISIDLKRDDEIGLLVDSFNRMVRELRESKDSLQKAYVESDRRRVCMESIIENIDSGVISLDEKGKILTVNTATMKILNINPQDVIGKEYHVLLNHIESEELREFIRGIRLRDFTSTSRQLKVNVSDRLLTLRIFITQLRDPAGTPTGLLVVFEDLTGIVKAQQALVWQEVARRMAHEIKNPLTPIKLSTERLLRKWRQGGEDFGRIIEQSAQTIIREVESLQKMVDEFSRLGRMPRINKRQVDLKELLDEVVSLYRGYGRSITVHAGEEIPPVLLDREQFKRALINLFDNAVKATTDGEAIEVRLGLNRGRDVVEIEIADRGVGIRDEDKEKLFLPYFSTGRDGTGLGLAIVHRIITEHGGIIKVADNEPKGTVFAVELPCAKG
ncbi:MAG: HAMP domain-containing protein [Nitrospirae bacterium]|nr:HAMP domain-containing protein [Nitrospirota bacterium]